MILSSTFCLRKGLRACPWNIPDSRSSSSSFIFLLPSKSIRSNKGYSLTFIVTISPLALMLAYIRMSSKNPSRYSCLIVVAPSRGLYGFPAFNTVIDRLNVSSTLACPSINTWAIRLCCCCPYTLVIPEGVVANMPPIRTKPRKVFKYLKGIADTETISPSMRLFSSLSFLTRATDKSKTNCRFDARSSQRVPSTDFLLGRGS